VRIAIDTNRYTDLARGDAKVREVLERADEVLLPFPVLAELRAGFALGRHGAENERGLRRFLVHVGVSVLWADEQSIHHYATLFRQLRTQGTPIPTNDLWVAALVLQHDLVLYARDKHFDSVPQIPKL